LCITTPHEKDLLRVPLRELWRAGREVQGMRRAFRKAKRGWIPDAGRAAWLAMRHMRQRRGREEELEMVGDKLASGAKSATFGGPKVSQEKWDTIFGPKEKQKDQKPENRKRKT